MTYAVSGGALNSAQPSGAVLCLTVLHSCLNTSHIVGWLGGVMVRALDLRSSGRGFDSRSGRYQITALGKLFTPMCLMCHQAV